MKLKLDSSGRAMVRDGKPVYIMSDGTERAIDGAAAMKLALGKHFEASPVMARLKIPADVATSFFGDSFHIEGGKLVALDRHGLQMYSGIRHGEAADFDEAFGQLVDTYQHKDMILREPGTTSDNAVAHQSKPGSSITRARFDAMRPADRAKYITGGGRVTDGGAPAPASAPNASASGKTVSRAQFDAMSQSERMTHARTGGKIVD